MSSTGDVWERRNREYFPEHGYTGNEELTASVADTAFAGVYVNHFGEGSEADAPAVVMVPENYKRRCLRAWDETPDWFGAVLSGELSLAGPVIAQFCDPKITNEVNWLLKKGYTSEQRGDLPQQGRLLLEWYEMSGLAQQPLPVPPPELYLP